MSPPPDGAHACPAADSVSLDAARPVLVSVVPHKKVPGWPDTEARPWLKPEDKRVDVVTLNEALTREYDSDAWLGQYQTPNSRRLNVDAVDHGVAAELHAVMLDFDSPAHGTSQPAPDSWRAAALERFAELARAHPGVLLYWTLGGGRLVALLDSPVLIESRADAWRWRQQYHIRLAYLRRRFGLVCDVKCDTWNWLFRAPHATRDRQRGPERLPMYGDPTCIGVLRFDHAPCDIEAARRANPNVFEVKRVRAARTARAAPALERVPAVASGRGLFFRLLEARGAIVREHSANAFVIVCPNASEHTTSDSDTSTLLYVPGEGQKIGAIHCFHTHCDGKHWTEWLAMFDEHERELAAGAAGITRGSMTSPVENYAPPEAKGNGYASCPQIVVSAAEHDVNNQVIDALSHDPDLYQRNNRLVRVLRDDAADGTRMRIAPLERGDLRDRITRFAKLVRINADGECKPATPTDAMVRAVLERGQYPYRQLAAVTRTPVLARNGRVVQQAGYDTETQLLYEPMHAYPPVPEAPTRSDAAAAAERLLDVVCDTPFKAAEHRSAWLVYVLTLVGRPAIAGSTPMFAIDASTRGSGKTFLAEAGALIALGERVALQTFSTEPSEQRKHLSSVFSSGVRLLAYDNVAETLGGGPLNMAITGGRWGDRQLGKNVQIDEAIRAVLVATGNNINIGADLDRRIQHIRLEPREERPEEREDWRHPNPYAWLAEQHPQLLVAALTVMRAYYCADQPQAAGGLRAWAGFEAWSALIRSTIVWLGYADPIAARSELINYAALGDDAQRRVVEFWPQLGADGASAGEALTALYPEHLDRWALPRDHDPYPDLRAAVEELCGRKPDVRSLGRHLSKLRGRAFGGLYLALGPKQHGGVRRWRAQRLEAHSEAAEPNNAPAALEDAVDGFEGPGSKGQ